MSETKEATTVANDSDANQQQDAVPIPSAAPSITTTLFVYWIVPVLLLAVLSRFAVDTSLPSPPSAPPPRPIALDLNKQQQKRKERRKRPTPAPKSLSKMPTSYQNVVKQIQQRRPRWQMSTTTTPSKSSTTSAAPDDASSSPPPRDARISSDPNRRRLEEVIDTLRSDHKNHPDDVLKAIQLADALRQKDLIYHDGGSGQGEALDLYQWAIDRTLERKNETTSSGVSNIQDEFLLDYSQKSVDGLLCALYTAKGKQYFMANMFEKAVESHAKCLKMEPLYLDALNSKSAALIILGRYEDAARDLQTILERDTNRFFKDAFTGMAKVLTAKEEAVPQGWDPMVSIIHELVPQLETQYATATNDPTKQMVAEALNRLHHVLFTYHDVKTKDTAAAWKALTLGFQYKMSALPPFNLAYERQKVLQITQIFHKGFWPPGVGSPTQVPIFIIGFVRSGSTLLERVLDAHPLIVGTGEDSVFNGKLDYIRNSIVEASMSGSPETLHQTVQQMANEVVMEMRKRWQVIDANTMSDDDDEKKSDPERFADKMLTNYFNVGFIHMLFPNALILHVVREPMDTIFSAYKHEFPPGTLDYTSEFSSLAELYHAYRDVMQHWDQVLPGRVTHVRYEDLVHDMPGMAKAIIEATGLPWDDGVLDFHKKKQAVNTLSTTQVRKGIYKHSLEAWKRYEEPLQPLVKLMEDRVDWDLKTTLPSYQPPLQDAETN